MAWRGVVAWYTIVYVKAAPSVKAALLTFYLFIHKKAERREEEKKE